MAEMHSTGEVLLEQEQYSSRRADRLLPPLLTVGKSSSPFTFFT